MRRFLILIASTFVVFAFISCGELELPESLSIKTNAEFQVPVGTATYDFGDSLSPNAVREKIQDSLGSTASIYTYAQNANDDVLRYLVHYPAFNVPIDVGSYLSSMDFEVQGP